MVERSRLQEEPSERRCHLLVLNWMVNVLARYPVRFFSHTWAQVLVLRWLTFGISNLQTSSGQCPEKPGDVAFAYQFLAGMRTYVNKNVSVR